MDRNECVADRVDDAHRLIGLAVSRNRVCLADMEPPATQAAAADRRRRRLVGRIMTGWRLAHDDAQLVALRAPGAAAPRPRSPRAGGPTSRHRGRCSASSAAWVPRSAMRPSCSTMISSALITVDRRWAMTSVVRSAADQVERRLDLLLGVGVERRGRLVEDQDRRRLEDGAGDRHALLLAARQLQPALADHRCR